MRVLTDSRECLSPQLTGPLLTRTPTTNYTDVFTRVLTGSREYLSKQSNRRLNNLPIRWLLNIIKIW